MADYRLGILQTDIGIVFGCMRPLVKDHPCVAAVLARINLRPDCYKIAIAFTTLGIGWPLGRWSANKKLRIGLHRFPICP